MLNLKNDPTTDVEIPATPTRAMKSLNLAAVTLGVALAAGWDGLRSSANAPTTATARDTVARIRSSGTPCAGYVCTCARQYDPRRRLR